MVVIKDMQMPKCCIHCPAFDGEYDICNMTGEQETGMAAEERPDNCPLVPIVTCKDCKYWNRKEEYCKQLSNTMGWAEDEDYLVYTGADFFCTDGQSDLIEDALNLYYEKDKEGMSDLIQETIRYKKVISRVYDDGEPFCRHEVTEEEVNAVEIPKDATYGDVLMQILKSAGNYAKTKRNDAIYIYDTRKPQFASVAIDKKLWSQPFQRGEKT